MSKYTTELRFICESLAGELESKGYNDINGIITLARPKIFSFDYPIFDADYKPTLENKILLHYYTREICAETYGRWKLFLQSRLLEIMPYYNELYKSTLMDYDIFEDVNYRRSGERSTDEDGSNTNREVVDTDTTDTQEATGSTAGTETATAWDKYSDTPQGAVTNIDNDTYLTNARKNTNNVQTSGTTSSTLDSAGTVDTTRTNTGTHAKDVLEEYSELIKGKMPGKSYMELIKEFRDNIVSVDKMIIDDLQDLFFMIY